MTREDLKEWRKVRKLTQEQTARLLGVGRTTITHWELGRRKVPPYLGMMLQVLEEEGWIERAKKGEFPNWEKLRGEDLKRWRLERRLSQKRLGEFLGVSGACINRWEKEQRRMPPFLSKILEKLDSWTDRS